MNSLYFQVLNLTHFRNYDALRLELSPECVVLTGPNGAGKTNLLEAVSFFAPGRGLRRAQLSGVSQIGSEAWAVAAELHTGQDNISIGTGIEPGTERRLVRIAGKNKSQQELSKYFSALWLTPQMDQLFLETASAQRRFLDRLVFAFDSDHAARVSDYETAMRERNKLLEQPPYNDSWLTALENKMAELGIAMIAARTKTAEHLNNTIKASTLSFPKARVELHGFEGSEEEVKEKLTRARPLDASAGRCTFGIHRTEMITHFDTKNMRAENCSTGEQKALLLSIILGQARAVKEAKGTAPVLLLDEVVAHLDVSRRAELCEALLDLGSQCWLTGTDATLFEGLKGRSQRFSVTAGKAQKSA